MIDMTTTNDNAPDQRYRVGWTHELAEFAGTSILAASYTAPNPLHRGQQDDCGEGHTAPDADQVAETMAHRGLISHGMGPISRA